MKYAGEFVHKKFGVIRYVVETSEAPFTDRYTITVPGTVLSGRGPSLRSALDQIAETLGYFMSEGIDLPEPVVTPKKRGCWFCLLSLWHLSRA